MIGVDCTCDGRLRPPGFDGRVDAEAGAAWARLHAGDPFCAAQAVGLMVRVSSGMRPGTMFYHPGSVSLVSIYPRLALEEARRLLGIAIAVHLVGERRTVIILDGDESPGLASKFAERACAEFVRGFVEGATEPVPDVWVRDLEGVELDPAAPVTVPLTNPRHWLAGFPRAPKGSQRDRRNEIRDSLGEIAALEQIPGLSLSILQAVYRAGFTTLDAIASASDEDRERVPRVGPARARALRASALQLLEAWRRDPCGSGDER